MVTHPKETEAMIRNIPNIPGAIWQDIQETSGQITSGDPYQIGIGIGKVEFLVILVALTDGMGEVGVGAKGVTKVICTDISKDGMLQGPATDLYVKMKNHFSGLYVIASGGISCMKDVELLNEKGIDAVIIGKAIYEGKISMSDLQAFV